jgi:phage FluMu protein Com
LKIFSRQKQHECLLKVTESHRWESWRCPFCRKLLFQQQDMQRIWNHIQTEIDFQPMPVMKSILKGEKYLSPYGIFKYTDVEGPEKVNLHNIARYNPMVKGQLLDWVLSDGITPATATLQASSLSRLAIISCIECGTKNMKVSNFHYIGTPCTECKSFNTNLIYKTNTGS